MDFLATRDTARSRSGVLGDSNSTLLFLAEEKPEVLEEISPLEKGDELLDYIHYGGEQHGGYRYLDPCHDLEPVLCREPECDGGDGCGGQAEPEREICSSLCKHKGSKRACERPEQPEQHEYLYKGNRRIPLCAKHDRNENRCGSG